MIDDPFFLSETLPLITADQARDLGRVVKGLADHMASLGVRGEAARLERQSQWWLAYALVLGQPKPP